MMPAGAQPSQEAATPNTFPYTLRADKAGRKGQACRIVTPRELVEIVNTIIIEFEDGFRCPVDKGSVRRRRK